MSDTRREVLMHLSNGNIHAGTVLADKLNISRAAIWKHIQVLRGEGLIVDSISGEGYRLRYPLQLLDEHRIFSQLNTEVRKSVDLQLLWQVTSTNDWLKQRMAKGLSLGSACIAEQQTTGRGTKGRQWFSPPGVNIYLSLYWAFDRPPSELGGLSIAVAMSVVRQLTAYGYRGLLLKWPNDIHTAKGKLGGILIDMSSETNGPTRTVIGIGLNIGMHENYRASIDQPVDDLAWQNEPLDMERNQLAAMIINTLFDCCRAYQREGFGKFYEQWVRWDMVKDQVVSLQAGEKVINGVARGVDQSGALLLETENEINTYASGEISLEAQL